VAVRGEGDTDDIAVPAGEFLQPIRASADVGADRRDGPIMRARGIAAPMSLQEKTVLLHEQVDPLDRSEAGGSPLALEKRGDPPVQQVGR